MFTLPRPLKASSTALLCGAVLSILTWPTTAQAPKTATNAGVTVLKAAHLFDAAAGRVVSPGIVVVENGKIVAAGTSANTPANAQVIDLGNATLLPGFIDAHVHLTDEAQDDYYRGFHEDMMRFPGEQAHYAAMYARRTLEAGFTTVRNVGAADFLDIGLRNAINSGITPGPRILAAAHAVGSTAGHCDGHPFPPDRIKPRTPVEGVCNGADECRAAVRYQMKWGADVIKICASGGVMSPNDPVDTPQLTTPELEAIMSEAHAWKRKVAAHSHGDLAARLAVEAGVDSIEHGSFLTEETLQLMKKKGTYLVPTRMAVWWTSQHLDKLPPLISAKGRAAGLAHEKAFRTALKVGVPIAIGTDAGVYPHGMNAHEFSLLVDIGMSPTAALLAGTREGAKLLGVDSEVGTLEPGKVADVVAVSGNVLDDIKATEKPLLVMHLGKVVLQRSGS